MCLLETLLRMVISYKVLSGCMRSRDIHLYPFSLNSYDASPIFLSETTPRGHEPRTACKIAGVECKGGLITRKRVAEGNDKANGTFLTAFSPIGLDIMVPGELGRGDDGLGEPDRVEDEKDVGIEKATASRSSFSRP